MEKQINSIAIVERDTTGERLTTFTYPAFPNDVVKGVIESRIEEVVSNCEAVTFFYSKFQDFWYYCRRIHISHDAVSTNDKPSLVERVLVIGSTDFNPSLYESLSFELLSAASVNNAAKEGPTRWTSGGLLQDLEKASQTKLLAAFFKVFAQGKVGNFNADNHDKKKARLMPIYTTLLNKFSISDVVAMAIAMILKRKIAVTSKDPIKLIQFVSTLPTLVWHRQQTFDSVRPLITLNHAREERDDGFNALVVGSCDGSRLKALVNNSHDLFVDIDTSTLTVLSGGTTPKSISTLYGQDDPTQLEQNPCYNVALKLFTTNQPEKVVPFESGHVASSCDNDAQFIVGFKNHVAKLIQQLASIDEQNRTLSFLRSKTKNNEVQSQFLFALASAENLVTV